MKDGLEIGAVIAYDNEGTSIIGVITAEKKDKWVVHNDRDRDIELPSGRISRIGTQKITDKTKVLSSLQSLRKIADGASISTKDLWELIHEDYIDIESDALARIYFGETCSIDEYIQMYFSLIKDKVYFKRGKKVFSPRSETVINDLLAQAQAKEEKLKSGELLISFFQKRLDGEELDVTQFSEEIYLLFLAASQANLSTHEGKEIKDILDIVAHHLGREIRDISDASYQLLRDMRLLDKNTNLAVYRHRIPEEFPKLPSLSDSKTYSVTRTKIDHEFLVTIDDEDTKDIDDAISVSKKPYGYEIGIHITDVASKIEKDSEYDILCKRRATSIYLADRTIHMLPTTLSEESLSLVAGKERVSISVLIEIIKEEGSENFTLRNARVVPSILTVKERVSYTEADKRIAVGDEFLNFLLSVAKERESLRFSQGALKVAKTEIRPEIGDNGEIILVESNETESARFLVGEFMVLANSIFANFCISHELPIPFRSQEPLDASANEEIQNHPEGQARDFALRVRLKRSSTTPHPAPHATLGIPAYTQATSPIRRYLDIIVQRQLLNFFATQSPQYSLTEIENEIFVVEENLAPAMFVSRESRRFYLLRYLEERTKTNRIISGTVVRTDGRFPLVELDEIFIAFQIKPEKKISLGDKLNLEIISVDPKNDYLRLQVK